MNKEQLRESFKDAYDKLPNFSEEELWKTIEQNILSKPVSSLRWVKAENDSLPKIGQKVIVKFDHGDSVNYETMEWDNGDRRFWKENNIVAWMPVEYLEEAPTPSLSDEELETKAEALLEKHVIQKGCDRYNYSLFDGDGYLPKVIAAMIEMYKLASG